MRGRCSLSAQWMSSNGLYVTGTLLRRRAISKTNSHCFRQGSFTLPGIAPSKPYMGIYFCDSFKATLLITTHVSLLFVLKNTCVPEGPLYDFVPWSAIFFCVWFSAKSDFVMFRFVFLLQYFFSFFFFSSSYYNNVFLFPLKLVS